MKIRAKQILRYILKTDRGNIIFICAVAFAITTLWSIVIGNLYIKSGDTATYFFAGEVFARGDIDYLRTPIYPLICHAFLLIFNNYVLEALSGLNLICFLISIVYFYRTIALYTRRRTIKCITTVLYAWSIPMAEMNLYIMTESLSISGMVLLLYELSLIYMGRANKCTIVLTATTLLYLIMLRPFNVCFIPVVLLVLFFAKKLGKLKHLQTTLLAFSGITAVLLCYCIWFKITFGIFGFSFVSKYNIFHLTFRNHPEDLYNCQIFTSANIGENKYRLWIWFDSVYSNNQLNKVINDNINEYISIKMDYLKDCILLIYPDRVTTSCHTYASPIQCVSFNIIYLLLFMLTIFTIYRWHNNKYFQFDAIATNILICVSCIFTAIFGSYNSDAARLAMPMFPSLCLLVGLFAEQTNLRFTNSVKPQYNFNKS